MVFGLPPAVSLLIAAFGWTGNIALCALSGVFILSPIWTLAVAAWKLQKAKDDMRAKGDVLFHVILALPLVVPLQPTNEELIGPELLIILASITLALVLFLSASMRNGSTAKSS